MTSYIRFFSRKEETRSASQIINRPPIMIAVAITRKTSVSAMALRMESNENTAFITMIMVSILAKELFALVSACRSSIINMCIISLVAV